MRRPDLTTCFHLLRTLQAWSQVQALELGGSVARGLADEFSDVELYAVCDRIPPCSQRQAWIVAHRDPGTCFFTDEAALGGVVDTFRHGGQDVTVVFQEIRTVEQGVRDLLTTADPDREQELAFGHELGATLICYDPHGLVSLWKEQIRHYPPARRAQTLAAAQRWQEQLWTDEFPAAAARDDPLWYGYRLAETVASLVHALCAFNEHYYVGPKRCFQHIKQPGWQPPGWGLRLQEIVETEVSAEALQARLRDLAGELWEEAEGKTPEGEGRRAKGEGRRASSGLPTADCREPSGWPTADFGAAEVAAEFNRGCDYVAGRLYVALRRGDTGAFLHYQHQALEAYVRVLGALNRGPFQLPLTPGIGTTALQTLRLAPPRVYERLCAALLPGPVSTHGKARRQQWLELWREVGPLIQQEFPDADLSYGLEALRRAPD